MMQLSCLPTSVALHHSRILPHSSLHSLRSGMTCFLQALLFSTPLTSAMWTALLFLAHLCLWAFVLPVPFYLDSSPPLTLEISTVHSLHSDLFSPFISLRGFPDSSIPLFPSCSSSSPCLDFSFQG
jgi:hypothetical protein